MAKDRSELMSLLLEVEKDKVLPWFVCLFVCLFVLNGSEILSFAFSGSTNHSLDNFHYSA